MEGLGKGSPFGYAHLHLFVGQSAWCFLFSLNCNEKKKRLPPLVWVVMKEIFRPLNVMTFFSTNLWIPVIILFLQAFKDGLSKIDTNRLGNRTDYKKRENLNLYTIEHKWTEADGADNKQMQSIIGRTRYSPLLSRVIAKLECHADLASATRKNTTTGLLADDTSDHHEMQPSIDLDHLVVRKFELETLDVPFDPGGQASTHFSQNDGSLEQTLTKERLAAVTHLINIELNWRNRVIMHRQSTIEHSSRLIVPMLCNNFNKQRVSKIFLNLVNSTQKKINPNLIFPTPTKIEDMASDLDKMPVNRHCPIKTSSVALRGAHMEMSE